MAGVKGTNADVLATRLRLKILFTVLSDGSLSLIEAKQRKCG